jgi:hypothetical protein
MNLIRVAIVALVAATCTSVFILAGTPFERWQLLPKPPVAVDFILTSGIDGIWIRDTTGETYSCIRDGPRSTWKSDCWHISPPPSGDLVASRRGVNIPCVLRQIPIIYAPATKLRTCEWQDQSLNELQVRTWWAVDETNQIWQAQRFLTLIDVVVYGATTFGVVHALLTLIMRALSQKSSQKLTANTSIKSHGI